MMLPVELTGVLPPFAINRAASEDVAIVAIIFGCMSAVLLPLVRAWGRRLEGRGKPEALPLPDIENRLDRIERAVESIAIEVERVSEGQRFVTKLLAERPADGRARLPGSGE
jgi:hypothetical protein